MERSEIEAPRQHSTVVGGIELAYFEWGQRGRSAEPTIFFAHATGFHARVWDQVIRHLGARHMISVDLRGHGRSKNTPIETWRVFGEDLTGLIGELGLEAAIGVGHSMGAHALVEAAASSNAFQRLVLVDPVIASPGDYSEGGWSIERFGGQHPTARRKNRFASCESMFERFKDRHPYSIFEPAALRNYCDFGLVPAQDGDGLILACPPEIESQIYMTSRSNPGVYDSVRALEIPVMILRARERGAEQDPMDFSSSPTWPGLVHEFKDAREVYLPDHTHFLPMEVPDLVARYVAEGG